MQGVFSYIILAASLCVWAWMLAAPALRARLIQALNTCRPASAAAAVISAGYGILTAVWLPEATAAMAVLAACMAFILVLSAITDVFTRCIPNVLVLASMTICLAIQALAMQEAAVARSLASMGATAAFLLIIRRMARGELGMGDIKLMACTAMWLGLSRTFAALFIACLACSLTAGVLLVMKKKKAKSTLPFAPFIALGSLTALFF